jgi:hypothetical protein
MRKLMLTIVATLALTSAAFAGTSCTTECKGGAGSSTSAACYTTCN